MAIQKAPKVLLFDMGGVCVLSPFQAILDYEKEHSIPIGYINFSISRTSPNGFWQRLERGEIPMDSSFFTGFQQDLRNQDSWQAYHEKLRKTTSGFQDDKLEAAWISANPVPEIDAEYLFWKMMGSSRKPDPYIYPALKELKASNKFVLAGLSNTVIFPPGHPYNDFGLRGLFDVFVSSAHVGMRKPDPKIYQYTLEKLRDLLQERGQQLEANEIVFLDDIGENVKAARMVGMRTIKVVLGRTLDAVRQLEEITDMPLVQSDESNKARL